MHLAAARLREWHLDGHAQPFQQFDCGFADRGEDPVDQAGDEQRDHHGRGS